MAYTNNTLKVNIGFPSERQRSENTMCPGLIIRLERSPKSATSHFNYKLKLFASNFLFFLTTNTKRKKKDKKKTNKLLRINKSQKVVSTR